MTSNRQQVAASPWDWVDNMTIEEKQVALDRGDTVLIYTDGIIECMNNRKEPFGENRLKNFIEKNSHLSPEEFSKKVHAEVESFLCESFFDDDVTYLMLKIE